MGTISTSRRELRDLLFHLPLRYQDRTHITPIAGLQAGRDAVIEGVVRASDIVFGRRRSLVCRLQDGSGTITLRFFHFSAAQRNQLEPGTRLRCYGEPRRGASGLALRNYLVGPDGHRLEQAQLDALEILATHREGMPMSEFAEQIPRLGDRYFHSRLTSDMTHRVHELRELRPNPEVLQPGDILHTAQSLFHDHVPAQSFGLATAWIDRQRLSESGRWARALPAGCHQEPAAAASGPREARARRGPRRRAAGG